MIRTLAPEADVAAIDLAARGSGGPPVPLHAGPKAFQSHEAVPDTENMNS